jgi:predicted dehydrogenase
MKKIGIIGFGSIGQRHYNNIRSRYSKFQINILTKRKNLKPDKNTAVFASEKDFFNQVNDIFFITNETDKHAETILKCLSQNPRGIFVEKPIAHSLNGVSRIAKLVSQKRPVFMVGYCLQFHRTLLKMRELVRDKILGDVIYIRASVGQDLRTWRKRDYKVNYSYDSSRGGGVILDLIHDINYPAWLLGEEIFLVNGLAQKTNLFDIKSEDMAEGIFKSEKGRLVSVHQDYLQNMGRRYCEIAGTKGTAVWDSLDDEIRLMVSNKKVRSLKTAKNDIYVDELKFFIKKVSENKGYTNINEGISDLKNALALKKTYV